MAQDIGPTTRLLRQEARMDRLLTREARIIRIRVGPQAGVGWRLDRYLAGILPQMPRSLFQRWCRAGHVRVGQRRAKAADQVRAHQDIEIVAPLPELPADDRFDTSPLQVLHEGDGFVVVNKPPGQLAHQAGRVLSGTLLNQLQDWLEQRGIDPQEARLVNRIDKDTSGIVLCAWDSAVAGALGSDLQDRALEKIYLAICHRCPEPASGDWHFPIADNPASRIRRLIAPHGQPCHTSYTIDASSPGGAYSLLRIHLHTGRQHQIRIHAAHAGHPLVGDWVYGEPCTEIRGQCLHAHRLRFTDPGSGATITVTAPLTAELDRLWQHLQAGGHVTPRQLGRVERNKLHIPAGNDLDADVLPEGWRRPSWLNAADWQDLRSEWDGAH